MNTVNTLLGQNLKLLHVKASGAYTNHSALKVNLDGRRARIA
jgi:hypothetical protein